MAGTLLLQRHADVSDREATERLQFDLRWQYALRLPMDFPEISHSNLSRFRSRLIVHELEGRVFDRLAEMATEAGVVDPGEEQATDSSHIFGAAAVQATYELLQDGVRKLLETATRRARARRTGRGCWRTNADFEKSHFAGSYRAVGQS